jgi:hypothetical protein
MVQDLMEDFQFYCKFLHVDKPLAHQYKGTILCGLVMALPTLFSRQSILEWRQMLEVIMAQLPGNLQDDNEE